MLKNRIIAETGFSTYLINNKLLTDDSLKNVIDLFFNDLIPDRKYFVLLRLQFHEDGRMVTLHKGIVINNLLSKEYFRYCVDILALKNTDYNDKIFEDIIFNFFLIDKSREQYYIDKWSEIKIIAPIKLEKFSNSTVTFFLPLNRNYLSWGLTILNQSNIKIVIFHGYIFKINLLNNGLAEINIFKGKNKLYTFYDSGFRDDVFLRKFDNVKYYINTKTEKIVLTTKELKTKYLTKIKDEKSKNPKIITFDIETIRDKNNNMVPYLYSMYDGKKIYSFFTDSPQPLFNSILRRKYKGYTVYAHNLSKFDIIFIFKYIAQLSLINKFKIKPIIKDGRIISIDIRNDHGISIKIRDSYLMLTESLLKLSKTFKCDQIKMMEPVLISCSDPEKERYVQNNILHYNKEVLKIDNFEEWKKLVIKYCENDSLILHQILINFRELVFENWSLNIENYPTISSLAFAIYRKKYLKENMIPITTGKVFDFIKESFTGGSTDVYKLYGENIRVYDANSLYPSTMKYNKFPIGPINQFEGDISILDKDNTYWIADSFVKTKRDLYYPYLQIHHKINGMKRTVSCNGSWNMKIHCCEYYNSLEDYDITFTNGYFFEKGDLFSEFVDDLYNLRLKYPKGDPMNLTCKLILNSLFGRLAMKPIISIQSFMSRIDFFKLTENCSYEIEDFLDLGDLGFFVSYSDPFTNKDHKISIGIASAITAMSRVVMANLFKKNKYKLNLYNSDTDSAFLDTDLPQELIGNELGKFKLEYVFKKAIFLSPKCYMGITEDGTIISKIKGFKNADKINFDDLITLLGKDCKPLELHHEKWYRFLDKSEIHIKDEIYQLIMTENKREIIYDEKGIAIDTKPFKIEE